MLKRVATISLFSATALLAVGFRYVFYGQISSGTAQWLEPAQRLLLLLALYANVAAFGLWKKHEPWPLYALCFILVQTFFLGWFSHHLAPGLKPTYTLQAVLALALPWLFVEAKFGPGRRMPLAFLVALLPLISVLVGLIFQFGGFHRVYTGYFGGVFRLQGATKGDYFAALAFAGVLVALHEWVRTRRWPMGALIFLNLIFLIFSGARMGLFAAFVAALVYFIRSRDARNALWRLKGWAYVGAMAVGVAMVVYAPVMVDRMYGMGGDQFNFSGRRIIWARYLDQFHKSIWFGRGLGAGQEGVFDPNFPHNEYLRFVVEGGVVGGLILLLAIVLWAWRMHGRFASNDRPFLLAFMVGLTLYALTDNPLSATYLSGFVYLGMLRNEGWEKPKPPPEL